MTKHQVAAFYVVNIFTKEEWNIFEASCAHNKSRSKGDRRKCNKYSLGSDIFQVQFELSPEKDATLPALAAKINHHFTEFNVAFEVRFYSLQKKEIIDHKIIFLRKWNIRDGA